MRYVALPVCLPWNSDDPGFFTEPGEGLTVTGWGTTSNNRDIVGEVCVGILLPLKIS